MPKNVLEPDQFISESEKVLASHFTTHEKLMGTMEQYVNPRSSFMDSGFGVETGKALAGIANAGVQFFSDWAKDARQQRYALKNMKTVAQARQEVLREFAQHGLVMPGNPTPQIPPPQPQMVTPPTPMQVAPPPVQQPQAQHAPVPVPRTVTPPAEMEIPVQDNIDQQELMTVEQVMELTKEMSPQQMTGLLGQSIRESNKKIELLAGAMQEQEEKFNMRFEMLFERLGVANAVPPNADQPEEELSENPMTDQEQNDDDFEITEEGESDESPE